MIDCGLADEPRYSRDPSLVRFAFYAAVRQMHEASSWTRLLAEWVVLNDVGIISLNRTLPR